MKEESMSRHQITCINKTDRYNPHERIKNIGGLNGDGSRWKLPQAEGVEAVESGKYSFYVNAAGRTVDVIVAKHNGNKYLKTVADGEQPDNLLSLDECP
jgi:hypothetical protein